jgi:hypothetical protein
MPVSIPETLEAGVILTLPLKLEGPSIVKAGEAISVPVQIIALADSIYPPGAPAHSLEKPLEVVERSRLPLACTTTFPADS